MPVPNPTGEVRSPLAEQKAIAIRRRNQRATISVIIASQRAEETDDASERVKQIQQNPEPGEGGGRDAGRASRTARYSFAERRFAAKSSRAVPKCLR
jgi:hypothetical protein